MATQFQALTREWVEVVSELTLEAGTAHTLEAQDGPVEYLVTEAAASPAADARARVIWPGSDYREADRPSYTPAAGEYLHARAARGESATLAVDAES